MSQTTGLAIAVAFLWSVASPAFGVSPTADEQTDSQRWAASRFEGVGEPAPSQQAPTPVDRNAFFSFVYDGKPSADLLKTWELQRTSRELDAERKELTQTYNDPKTGLTLRCVGIVYRDFPAVEWTLYFKNRGEKDTPILEDVQALDIVQPLASDGTLTVHHGRGSQAAYSDFEPLCDLVSTEHPLKIGTRAHENGRCGNSSVESMPFFNVEADQRGAIVGIGWTGPWAAQFTRTSGGEARVQAGVERMHLVLRPGEEIRSPRVAMLFWRGDVLRSQNLWRRFVLTHHSPRPGGKPFTGLIADGNWGSWMPADRHIEEINFWSEHDLPMECYWVDAGWTDMSLGWEAHQSQQTPNPALFPNGLRPLSDAAHRHGMRFLLWMVPGSVHPAVGIGKEHPEWLGEPFGGKEYGAMVFHGLDHGDPEVNRFMIARFSKVVHDFGMDVLRQDGGNLWPKDTDPNRVGMSQIRYIQGAYAFWDGLLDNCPNLLIDNCAEGGRKIDLETISRSVVFWRSDCQASGDFDDASNQAYNYGLLKWTPLCGGTAPMKHLSAYSFRSAYCPVFLIGWPMGNVNSIGERWSAIDINLLRELLKEYVSIRPYLFGDFYPLTSYSLDAAQWMAWQYDRPENGDGMVQAFRRPKCSSDSISVKLHGLEPQSVYTLTNLDRSDTTKMSGNDLMEKGLSIAIQEQPGSAIVTYTKDTPNTTTEDRHPNQRTPER